METLNKAYNHDKLEAASTGGGKQKTVIGLPWYSEDEWLSTKQYCSDPESFFDDYKQWKREAERAVVVISNMGYDVKLLPIYHETFKGWCTFHRIQPNKRARRRFTNYLLKRDP